MENANADCRSGGGVNVNHRGGFRYGGGSTSVPFMWSPEGMLISSHGTYWSRLGFSTQLSDVSRIRDSSPSVPWELIIQSLIYLARLFSLSGSIHVVDSPVEFFLQVQGLVGQFSHLLCRGC